MIVILPQYTYLVIVIVSLRLWCVFDYLRLDRRWCSAGEKREREREGGRREGGREGEREGGREEIGGKKR
jgi:hypothetical protein